MIEVILIQLDGRPRLQVVPDAEQYKVPILAPPEFTSIDDSIEFTEYEFITYKRIGQLYRGRPILNDIRVERSIENIGESMIVDKRAIALYGLKFCKDQLNRNLIDFIKKYFEKFALVDIRENLRDSELQFQQVLTINQLWLVSGKKNV